jgi:hypothetical protein
MAEFKKELVEHIGLKTEEEAEKLPEAPTQAQQQDHANFLREELSKFLNEHQCTLEDVVYLSVVLDNMKTTAMIDQRVVMLLGRFSEPTAQEKVKAMIQAAKEREHRVKKQPQTPEKPEEPQEQAEAQPEQTVPQETKGEDSNGKTDEIGEKPQ